MIIAADDSFTAILNGCKTFTGSNWRTVNRFLFRNLKCGIDTLVITVENSEVDSPAAVIFAVPRTNPTVTTVNHLFPSIIGTLASASALKNVLAHQNTSGKLPICGCMTLKTFQKVKDMEIAFSNLQNNKIYRIQ